MQLVELHPLFYFPLFCGRVFRTVRQSYFCPCLYRFAPPFLFCMFALRFTSCPVAFFSSS